jgi:hypothetical protein
MESQWYFKRWQPGDTPRDPIQGEFFATEAIKDSAEALVRESIQNSLDARRDGQIAKVRFFVSGMKVAVPRTKVEKYLPGLGTHLEAKRNGLYEPPDADEPCSFVVVEDFGTKGLEGDPAQWHRIEGSKNGFFTFFRAEGVSDKAKTDRGRWGIGKFVFPRSSRISGFFGLTTRASDGQRLLLGRTILKSHSIGADHFVPDGYFGVRPQAEGLVLPVSDKAVLDEFEKTFHLKRGTEPGLSVVVMWPFGDITSIPILQAVIRGYFSPILKGDLEVTVETPDHTQILTSQTLDSVLDHLSDDFSATMKPQIALARWGTRVPAEDLIVLSEPSPDGGPKWTKDMIGDEVALRLWERLSKGERIAIRVPLIVRPKSGHNRTSFFDIFMQRGDGEDLGRPLFVREGILISDAKGGSARGVRSLVTVDHDALATLLGDAENPAHTEWRPDTSNFKNQYHHGPTYLTFVKESVANIVRLITEDQTDVDPNLLMTSLLWIFHRRMRPYRRSASVPRRSRVIGRVTRCPPFPVALKRSV